MDTNFGAYTCPQCQQYLAVSLIETNNLEYVSCPACGYEHKRGWEYSSCGWEKHGCWASVEDEMNEDSIDVTTKVRWNDHEQKGYGVFSYLEAGQWFSLRFHSPLTADDISHVRRHYINRLGLDPMRTYMTRWNDETKRVELIFGQFGPFVKEIS